jgi:hypothetical protein
MEALIAALAPKRRGWTTKALLLAVVGVGLAQCVPSRSASASAFVASAHASCLGPLAVAHAHQGNVEAALHSLKLAEDAKRSNATSLGLASASQAVARELEGRITPISGLDAYVDANQAWDFTIAFARDAGDADLYHEACVETIALHDRLKAFRRRRSK